MVKTFINPNGRWRMYPEPAPGTGGDGEPAVPAPPRVPDWMDDADWELSCASHAAEGLPEDGDSRDPDPDDGPPEEWAELSVEEITARAEADGAEHAALMARLVAAGLGEGYAHRRGDPPVPGVFSGPGAGFGQGRALEQAAPEPGLAMLADAASGPDRSFDDVTDDQLLGLMSVRRRLQARQEWELVMAVAEFIRRRPRPGCALEGPARLPRVWAEAAAGELRAQLHLTAYQADALLDLACDLAGKLPVTSAALRDGVIDLGRAQLVASRCSVLTVEEARAAEAIVFADPDVGEWTDSMLRDRVARAVMEVNPQAAVKRRERAAQRRRVEVRAEDSGNAVVAGRELPAAAAVAAGQLLTARARQLRAAGVGGGMDELRVLAYLEKLGVLDPLGAAQAAGAGETGGGPLEDSDGGSGDSDGGNGGAGGRGPAGPGAPGGPAGSGGGAGAVPGMVPGGFAARANLTLPLATLLGLAERPGVMTRIGAVDPALARDLAVAAASNPATTWCLTIIDSDGRPAAHGCGRPPPRNQRAKAPPGSGARDGPAGTPAGDRPGGYGTVRLNLAAVTGADGGAGGGGAKEGGSRELAFALENLAGPCDHKHQASGHDPGRMLRHLTGILNAHCTCPPCRRPEATCDYEHSTPYDKGGRTCLCDSGPVCRTDHQNKQAPGWHLEQAGARGWFRWTTPSGRTYISRPTQYPA